MSSKRLTDEFIPHVTLHPVAGRWLEHAEMIGSLFGVAAICVLHGSRDLEAWHRRALAALILVAIFIPLISLTTRYVWSLARSSFLRENAGNAGTCLVWIVGTVILMLTAVVGGKKLFPLDGLLPWTEFIVLARASVEMVVAVRLIARLGWNPAFVLAGSFVVLIGVGTLLLMLPQSRAEGEPSADWLTALFTSTSACCVTGLTVVDTGTYWSRTGQVVIMLLIQVGGLGIMTFGAFFAVVLGGGSSARESATMRDLLESERLSDVAGMLRSILGLTLGIELAGAILLSGLWADQPLGERVFQSVFHSVSAFCNAGFSTRGDINLTGWHLKWQVWGIITLLIILGGFGFAPLANIWNYVFGQRWLRRGFNLPETTGVRVRLTLSTKLVSVTTLGLLIGGTIVLLAFEWNNPAHPQDPASQVANAWFHSVTLRTAGFNTIDHGQLNPASKLFGIMLMFVGASAGSTGGGVKTICLAISVLTLRAVLKGRTSVEVWGRRIPSELIFKGLAVIALALTVLMVASIGIIVIEDNPQLVLDHLYNTASALGTVGVAAGSIGEMQPASKLILVATMFLGRIGALTLVAALAGSSSEAVYEYPEEKVALG